jgi:hypothetical protein
MLAIFVRRGTGCLQLKRHYLGMLLMFDGEDMDTVQSVTWDRSKRKERWLAHQTSRAVPLVALDPDFKK